MNRTLISSGSPFEEQIAYSRAVVQGDWIFVSGTTGFDYETMTISPVIEDQATQCLENIKAALAQAGATLADVVRVHYILPNGQRLRTMLAGAQDLLRAGSSSRDDDLGQPARSSHAHRD
jgi:enamine deaminase RidA (YjgF/YER057c/UK114 family)